MNIKIVPMLLALAAADCATACAAEPTSDTGPDTGAFYSASSPVYLSVDGQTVVSFNQLMNIMKVSTPSADGPTMDVDERCSRPGLPCVTLLGLTLATPPRMEKIVAKEWSAGDARFHAVLCTNASPAGCLTLLISVEGKDGVRGWYTYSQQRGVELFARRNNRATGGYDEVFMLTAEAGVLRSR